MVGSAPYTLERVEADLVMAYADDLRIVAAGDDEVQAVAHFAESLKVALATMPSAAPERAGYERALTWFDTQGLAATCVGCATEGPSRR